MPLAEVYFPAFENFYIVWTNEHEESDVGVTPACGGVGVFPAPRSFEVSRISRKRPRRRIPGARFGNNTHAPTQQFPRKAPDICLDESVHGVALWIVTRLTAPDRRAVKRAPRYRWTFKRTCQGPDRCFGSWMLVPNCASMTSGQSHAGT